MRCRLCLFLLVGLPFLCALPGGVARGQESNGESVASVPVEYESPREVLQAFLQRMSQDEKAEAAELLDLSELPPAAAAARGSDLAFELFAVMQRLVTTPGNQDWPPADEELAFSEVPDDADYPSAWKLSELERYAEEEAEQIQIARGADKYWRFSAETVAALDALFEQTEEHAPRSQATPESKTTEPISVRIRRLFPKAMREDLLYLPRYQWVCLLVVAVAGLVVQWVSRRVLTRVADWALQRAEPDFKETTTRVWKPIALLANAATWYWGALVVGLPIGVVGVLLVVLRLLTVVAAVRVAFALIGLVAAVLQRRAKQTERKFDDLLIPVAATTTKVLAALVGVLAAVAAFNEELPSTLLGGLGIGGVAIALASQETLSNFFGSLMVLFDRPFELGDWVIVEGIEGEVESVGFRSTRIRTALNSQVTIPNSKLAAASVDNLGRRRWRRYLTRLGVEYSTSPEQIEAFCEGIRELIRRQPHTRKDFYAAYFNDFGASALEVLLVVYFEVPDWPTELRERHRLLADIVRLAKELEVGFAFPTQTVHMFQEKHTPEPAALDDPERAGQVAAAEIAGELLNYQDRPGKVKFTGPTEVEKMTKPE